MFRVTTSLFVLSFFFCSVILAQSDTVITSLTGMEDKEGNTHLIYKIYYSSLHEKGDTTRFDYYHFDTFSGTDTLVFDSYTITSNVLPPPSDIVGKSVVGFQFFNKNPNDFIFAYNYVYGDVSCGFGLPGMRDIYFGPASIDCIQAYGDSVWANYGQKVIISSDKGKTWPEWNIPPEGILFFLNSVSPFNRNIYFGNDLNGLIRSLNQGKTYTTVAQGNWPSNSRLFYDSDQKHIYGLADDYVDHCDLLVSNKAGEENSWTMLLKNKPARMPFAIDDSISGEIYYAKGNKIFKSVDYGTTFSLFKELDQPINGLYKKPKSLTLYCSTRTFIYEFNGDQVKIIKKFSIKKALVLYPLQKGNKWFYHTVGGYADLTSHPINYYEKVEIIDDTILQNGKSFFIKKSSRDGRFYNIEFERIDSLTGRILREYGGEIFEENLMGDLTAAPGNHDDLSFGYVTYVTDSLNTIFGIKRRSKTFRFSSLDLMSRQYAEGLGIVKETHMFDFGYTTVSLTGCVIDGILFGDTVMVDVDEPQKIPLQYKLLQNYPNPFNPITKIKYSVPVAEMSHASSLQSVTLKVYDVLGREVSTIIKEEKYPGNYEVEFDGSHMSSGIYFYQLRAENEIVLTKKMMLLK
jgi:hypothetical protein